MANLKRRPDKDLNHENWDQDEAPEEKGEFKRATEDEMRSRRILTPRRKQTASGSSGATASTVQSNNPFSAFAFGSGTSGASSVGAPSFGGFSMPTTIASTNEAVTPGGTVSLFKIAGITPSAEPPTRASADSSTADTPGTADTFSAGTSGGQKQQEMEPEVGSVSESDGITEESSNSSSLPWNVSRHQDSNEEKADSMQNIKGTTDRDVNNDNWVDEDEPAASAEVMQTSKILHTNRQSAQTSSAPADSSESSSASNPNPSKNPFASFSFGSSFGGSSGIPSGSLFQPFASASAAVTESQTAAATSAAASSSSVQVQQQTSQPQVSASANSGNTWSPESSGIIARSSIEDDSADYENDTTSSSNKLHSENDVSNDYHEPDNEDREAEADCEANDEREAEGVDS